MNRRSTNMKVAFKATNTSYSEEMQAALNERRAKMDSLWDALDRGWKALEKRMVTIGTIRPVSLDSGVVHLNAGGLNMTVRYNVLDSLHEKNDKSSFAPWTLANLFDGEWDSRIPRDKGGRIFLDESPAILKHLVHTQINDFTKAHQAGRMVLDGAFPILAAYQHPYLRFFSKAVLGLQPAPFEVRTIGGSTVLEDDDLARLSIHVREWCSDAPRCVELIYRGSRDGLTANAFRSRCTDDSPSTITLIQVEVPTASGGSDCFVVGGFSSVPWTPTGSPMHENSRCSMSKSHEMFSKDSPGAFIFMVRDGMVPGGGGMKPVRWVLPPESSGQAVVRCGTRLGPDFGDAGFSVGFRPGGPRDECVFYLGENIITTGVKAYRMQMLLEQHVADIEVYRVRDKAPSPIVGDDVLSAVGASNGTVAVELVDDTRLFGASNAAAFLEERIALKDAQAELELAEKRVGKAASALAAIYGPDIALGKPDPVVELSVRGTKMATLRSTLQACPESALAAKFNKNKWLCDEKQVVVIDFCPSTFAKVLDVLRVRKRVGWFLRGRLKKDSGTGLVAGSVVIPAGDRVSFEKFVCMHFPGCEEFVMDVVEFQGS